MEAAAGHADADRPVRVLVVDDSALCRDLLAEIIAADPHLQLVGAAVDGRDAVQKVEELEPDLVTMDLRMPVMDGIQATSEIMQRRPTPILVLTGHPFQSGRNMTFDAIRAGALDLMIKPDLGNVAEIEKLGPSLTELIRFLGRIDVTRSGAEGSPEPTASGEDGRTISAVAMAASAGGPRAVHAVLSSLPSDFPAGILLVQHIAEGFTEEFAAWLDSETALEVRIAEHDDEVRPGCVLVAPAEAHLRLMPGGTCKLIRGMPIGGYRPSADVLFSSVARIYGDQACGVILSGMGEDGVSGVAEIHDKGGLTLAVDEGEAMAAGMSAAAIARGAIDRVLPLPAIGPELSRRCTAAGTG